MNPRRLDIEAYRDNLLQVSGDLENKAPALSFDLDAADNHSRTVYGRVSRGRLNTILALYDFPDPMMTAPRRELTTSPLQQLFVMNSPFMQERAAHLAARVSAAPDVPGKDSRHVSRRGGPRPHSEGTGHGIDLSGQRNAGSIRSSLAGVE